MEEHEKGQVATSAAEIYEEFFVPALFSPWPSHVLNAADVESGDSVLDVGCGTGILARSALRVVGPSGSVVGVDVNEGMLQVARSKSTDVEWRQGQAESLPFAQNMFDRVVSQFGLMFFQDRIKAVSEMIRVMKRGGKACVAVWASLSATPGYAAVADMLRDVFDAETARSIEAPYCLGDVDELETLFEKSGASNISVNTVSGKARFASIDAWLYTDIKGWTLAEVIDDDGYARLRHSAPEYLGKFVGEDGKVEFDAPANLVTFDA